MSLTLSLRTNTIPVTLEDADGKETHYEIREMLAGQRDTYIDSLHARMERDAHGNAIGVKKFDGMQASLLEKTLYRDGKLVPAAEIQKWPGSVVSALYLESQKLNKLNAEDGKKSESETKNDSQVSGSPGSE